MTSEFDFRTFHTGAALFAAAVITLAPGPARAQAPGSAPPTTQPGPAPAPPAPAPAPPPGGSAPAAPPAASPPATTPPAPPAPAPAAPAQPLDGTQPVPAAPLEAAPPPPSPALAAAPATVQGPVSAHSEAYDPARKYPASTTYGAYQGGIIDGAEPGHLFRYVFGFSSMSGELETADVETATAQPLEVNLSAGHRFDLTRTSAGRVSLTVEGELGLIPIGFMIMDWPDDAPEDMSRSEALILPALTFGPAASLELALHRYWGIFVRPTFALVGGMGVEQEYPSYLGNASYSATLFGLQVGVLRYSLRRHFTMGLGFRSVSYSFETTDYGDDALTNTGFFFSIGSTG